MVVERDERAGCLAVTFGRRIKRRRGFARLLFRNSRDISAIAVVFDLLTGLITDSAVSVKTVQFDELWYAVYAFAQQQLTLRRLFAGDCQLRIPIRWTIGGRTRRTEIVVARGGIIYRETRPDDVALLVIQFDK